MEHQLESFVRNHNCDYKSQEMTVGHLKEAEEKIGICFGEELSDCLLNYGYLGYQEVEFYGLNVNDVLNSDLVKQTLYLHQSFPLSKPYIVLENKKDSLYVLVDSEDQVYEYDLILEEIQDTNMKLFDYIVKRFEEVE